MARAAALLLASAALCAAAELKESTTARNEVSEGKTSSKESKDFLDKLRFDLEPAMSHGFPLPLALPVPWSEDSFAQNSKSVIGQTANEGGNAIPVEVRAYSTNAKAGSESKSDLINTANRMIIEEARRRRLFKKKMETLLLSKLPKTSSKDEVRMLKPESVIEVEEVPERHGAAMMSDAFRAFRRIAHVVPLIHDLVSPHISSPFAALSDPIILKSENPSSNDEGDDDGGDHAVVMMRGFSFDGSPPVVRTVQRRPSESLAKLVPDDSVSIDVTFVPARLETSGIPRRSLTPLSEIEIPTNVGPEIPFPALPLISRVLNIMSSVRQRFMEDMGKQGNNSTESRNENVTKIELLENIPSSPQESSQPASNNTAKLELAEDDEKNDKLTSERVGEASKRSKRDVQSSSEREESTESPTAPKTRMMIEEEAEPQNENKRMMGSEIAVIGGQPSSAGGMPMGMRFFPTVEPNMYLNNMKMPFWKQFNKGMSYYMDGASMGFDKLAYQRKMYPKFPMSFGMAGAQYPGMTAPIAHKEYAMDNLAATQATVDTTRAALAGAAKAAAGATFHPLLNGPCVPTCAPLRGRRSARAKRSVRGGGGAAVQQALDASASQGKGGGEEKQGHNKAPTNDASSAKEPRKELKGKADSLKELLASSFRENLSNQKTPQFSPSRAASLRGTANTPESAEDETRKSGPDIDSVGFGNNPFQWRGQFPVEKSETFTDEGFPDADSIYRRAMSSSLKEFHGMKTVKAGKKTPSRSEQWETTIKPDQSAERRSWPAASAFGVIPYFSPLPDSLLGEGAGEEFLLADGSFPRPRRSVDAGGAGGGGEREVFWDEVAHAVRRSGHGSAARHAKVHSHGSSRMRSRLSSSADRPKSAGASAAEGEADGKRVKRVRSDRMPFLDPTMTEDSRFDSFFRRDMGNDFNI